MPLRFSRLRPGRVSTAALTGHGVTPGGADSGQAARMSKQARGRGGTSGRDTEADAGTLGARRQKAEYMRPYTCNTHGLPGKAGRRIGRATWRETRVRDGR